MKNSQRIQTRTDERRGHHARSASIGIRTRELYEESNHAYCCAAAGHADLGRCERCIYILHKAAMRPHTAAAASSEVSTTALCSTALLFFVLSQHKLCRGNFVNNVNTLFTSSLVRALCPCLVFGLHVAWLVIGGVAHARESCPRAPGSTRASFPSRYVPEARIDVSLYRHVLCALNGMDDVQY